ncbi:hypothetical protein M0R45_030646 [Rubus argutus]|uniref:Uncharacterized protein n=1 Tax=Rubus argutus TaxID=59490 RepID=A0AAW1WEA0_RUBAR
MAKSWALQGRAWARLLGGSDGQKASTPVKENKVKWLGSGFTAVVAGLDADDCGLIGDGDFDGGKGWIADDDAVRSSTLTVRSCTN